MRRHHTGSGRRTVFPDDWEAARAPVLEQFMLEAVVNLRKPGGVPVWNDTTGMTDVTPYPPFALNVPADIQPITGGSPTGVVDQQVWVLGYRIAVPLSATPTTAQLDEGVEVYVVSCVGDSMLVGATLHVNEVLRGTHRSQRVLIADLNS